LGAQKKKGWVLRMRARIASNKAKLQASSASSQWPTTVAAAVSFANPAAT